MADEHEICGFKTIQVKFDESTEASHVLYLKPHSVREEDERTPSERTLFVLNVPSYCNKGALRNVFGSCGPIQSVYIQKQPGGVAEFKKSFFNWENKLAGFKVAYVVFKKKSSLEKVLKLDGDQIYYFSTKEKPVETGILKWCKECVSIYPNPTKLQKEIDVFMKGFDKNKEEEKERLNKLQSEPDEDGWVTVGKGGRKPAASKVEAKEILQKKRKKQKHQLYFYNFQQRETRREHIAQLRKKFQEDKEKIEKMKATRKFRPY